VGAGRRGGQAPLRRGQRDVHSRRPRFARPRDREAERHGRKARAGLADDARGLRREALALAQAMLAADANLKSDYWHVVSLAELHVGLGEYAAAGEWCAQARARGGVSEWELQSSFLQLVSLMRSQGVPPPGEHDAPERWHPAWQAIAKLLDANAWLAFSCYRGKVGL